MSQTVEADIWFLGRLNCVQNAESWRQLLTDQAIFRICRYQNQEFPLAAEQNFDTFIQHFVFFLCPSHIDNDHP